MNETLQCQQCGVPLTGQALGELCANCLLKLALDPEVEPSAMSGESGEKTAAETLVTREAVGSCIGRYKLLQEIGKGGFGIVYLAEQTEPVKRRVALKVIKLGMDTRQVIARFEQERQALALMDHPNIARVLDAGATDTGRPYFVMELVRGIRITDYCDQANLPIPDRLQLFIAVCQAVQHAHQKGIIHRDLKPSNILVTLHDGVPVPKVIDFGVAKATQQRLSDLTVFTAFEQMVGTPLYMSPEQAEMSALDIDTRSDIYSLGVLLYELLTGRTPFDPRALMQQGLDEIRRTIREQEPQKPSTFLGTIALERRTTVAQHRQSDAAKLPGLIRGDLDWIVMKALAKDRSGRYETANGLVRDIQRHLADEPVQARPPSRVYRFRRMVRRNKLPFFATAAVAAALIGGLSFSILFLRGEQEQHRIADAARDAANASEIHARRLLYAADMNHAGHALQMGNLGRARRLLDSHRPEAGKADLRGWEWRYLWQECRGDFDLFTILTKRESYAYSVSLSADGSRLAVGFSDGRVELWDMTNRTQQPRVLQRWTGKLARVAFSPKGDILAATGELKVVMLHDFHAGTERPLYTAAGFIRDLAFSDDGEQLAVTTRQKEEWLVIDVRTSTTVGQFPPPDNVSNIPPDVRNAPHFNNVRLSPDHRWLYVTTGAFVEPELRCLKVSDGSLRWQPKKASGRTINGYSAMDLSPDGRVLVTATGLDASPINVWNTETGELEKELPGHTGWTCHLAFSRNGKMLASASGDQSIRLWDTETWEELDEQPLRGNGDEVHAVAFAGDGKWLASGSKNGVVMLWDLELMCNPQFSGPAWGWQFLPDRIQSVRSLPDSRTLVAADAHKKLHLIDLVETRARPRPLDIPLTGTRSFSPPNFLGIYGEGGRLRVYEITADLEAGVRLLGEFPVGADFIEPFAYSEEAGLLAWSDGSDTLYLRSLNDPDKTIDLCSGDKTMRPVIFGPGARHLLAASKETGEIHVWDIAGKNRLPMAENYLSPFQRDPRNSLPGLDNAAWNRGLYEWIAAATAPAVANRTSLPKAPPLPRGTLSDRAFSPDGRTFALSTLSGLVALYDAERRERLAADLHGHLQAVWAIVFSPNESRLLSIGNNAEAVKLWDVETQQELLTLPGVGALLHNATFTDDGSTIIVGPDGQPGLWQFWRAPSWKEIEDVERAGSAWPATEEKRE